MSDTAVQALRDEAIADLASDTMYGLLGGPTAIQAIVDRFYDLMDLEPDFAPIRRMHHLDLAPMRLSLFEYLSGWLGGPALFVQRHGSPCLTEAHAPFTIDQQAHDLWLQCMARALDEVGVPDKYRLLLAPALEGMAGMLRTAA